MKPCLPLADHGLLFPHSSFFDPFLISGALENTFHVNAWSDDDIGIEFAEINQFFHLRDGHLRRRGHYGVKISRCLAVNQVSPSIAFPCFDESVISFKGALQKILSAVE